MSKAFKSIHVIANPVAGQDDTVIAALNDALHESPFDWQISVTHKYGDGARLAKQAIDDGAECIAVYGGDGTIGDVLNGVYPHDIPMLVLSGGTGNGVARVLDIPADLAESAQYVASGDYDLVKADIGRIGDRLFLLRVDIGKMVEVVEDLEREDKDNFGMLSYYYAVTRTFTDDADTPMRFTLDGERVIEREAAAFIMLNLRRKREKDHKANIQNGAFEFFLVRSDLVEAAKGVAAYVDLVETDDMFEIHAAKRLKVETPEPLTVLADGEPCGETPVEMELLPQAVTLVVPS